MAARQDTISISQAKDEKTKAWTSAGSQSATSKGARFEDDVEAEGRMAGQKESGSLVMALPKLAPPLGFLVASQSFPLGFMPI